MQTEINSITRHLFQKENFDSLTTAELEGFINRYPYVSSARFLLAKKVHSGDKAHTPAEIITSTLYINNPLRLHWLLEEQNEPEALPVMENNNETAVQENPAQAATTPSPPEGEQAIVFQSYHTIDYFASQGIRLQQAEFTKDRLGQQLKSFTEWLRSMKKLPSAESDTPATAENDTLQQHVQQSAAHSIEEKEVVTEAMAEVWAKQGNATRARAIYDKLSLQNPDKRAYFAAKIDQLK